MSDCCCRSRGSRGKPRFCHSQTKSCRSLQSYRTPARDPGADHIGVSQSGCNSPPGYAPPSLTRVLKIAREHVEAMIAHAQEDHPDEACGVIVGQEGSDVPMRLVRMINADRSPTFFRFDPESSSRSTRR